MAIHTQHREKASPKDRMVAVTPAKVSQGLMGGTSKDGKQRTEKAASTRSEAKVVAGLRPMRRTAAEVQRDVDARMPSVVA